MQLWADSEPSEQEDNMSLQYSNFLPRFLQLPFIAPHCPNIPLAIELLEVFFRTYTSSGATESKWKLTANLRFVNYISIAYLYSIIHHTTSYCCFISP